EQRIMPKTLVIDDSETFRSLCLQAQTEDEQYQFTFAGGDAEAIEILNSIDNLDIAIVAVDRPDISGLDLFHQLQGRRIRVPRIALFSNINFSLIRSSMNQGAVDFLNQPVSLDDLTSTLDRVYRHTEERRRAWHNEAQLSAMHREIDIAREIQLRTLPGDFPPIDGIDVAARLIPAKGMSGDFYNLIELDQDRVGFVVADVSGKGVPAAFYMAVVSTLISTVALDVESPDTCLTQVNQLLCRHRIPGMFVSVFYATLNRQSWQIDYANGGHLPPYLIEKDGSNIRAVSGGEGVVLGVEESLTYQTDSLQLQPGESLALFTDGLTEAFNSAREQFGNDRVCTALTSGTNSDPKTTVEKTFAAVERFCGDADQSDDITLLLFKRRG
ncbi:MAG: SpoIIE family protein phosphatase, partial [Candidatus Sedimenticola sp. (ex Thyasira tokunagai)]